MNAERHDVLATQHTLAVLPERTGGRTVVNAGAPGGNVADIFRESQAYYIIGFYLLDISARTGDSSASRHVRFTIR